MTAQRKGTFRAYGPQKKLRQDTLDMIQAANHILDEYNGNVTVRQLYYQFVARGFTNGVNTEAMYNKIQAMINTGRMQGLISWDAIVDRGRNLMGLDHHPNISSAFAEARRNYRLDLWAEQPFRPEVWIEKEALTGVISNICSTYRVDFFACKGYNSQSEQWRAGRRFADYIRKGQRPIVFHLGDHDPSGIDMTRDNTERLEEFAGTPVIVQRLALNMSQVEEFNPPPNPAKLSDARAADYISKYGEESWELDALDPKYVENLIKTAVLRIRDETAWNESMQRENADLMEMDLILANLKSETDDED